MTPSHVDAVRNEFLRYRRLLELSATQVSDADFFRVTGADGNSIAVIIQHLAGNLRSRFTDFLSSDGEKSWRERDSEFELPTLERRKLLERMVEAWGVLDIALGEVEDTDAFHAMVTIRKQQLTVMEALYRSLAHHAYHVGQIVLLARTAVGDDWNSPSIPRGGSADYESNPTRERSPDGRG